MPSLGNIGLKLAEFVVGLDSIVTVTHTLSKTAYRIYSNKRRSAYLIFRAISAALIQGQRLSKHCTSQIYVQSISMSHHI